MEKADEILYSLWLEEQIKLSKWIIALSSGAALFSVKLVTKNTSLFWKYELIFGVTALVISILMGVRYVTLRIAFLRQMFISVSATKDITNYELLLDKERQVELAINIEEAKKDKVSGDNGMKEIAPVTERLFKWQHGLFYIGIISMVIFGIFSISQ